MVLLSGVAAGPLFLVTNESRIGGNDMEANLAYYGAESGMEKLTSDLSSLYSQYQVPKNDQIQNLINLSPDLGHGPRHELHGVHYRSPDGRRAYARSAALTRSAPVQSGIVRRNHSHDAAGHRHPARRGASVNITRKVEVALIPVFQFGVFCGYDCSYFPGPDFSFGGRVHTNQNLFLASGANLVFNDKISAFQQIVMDQLENGHVTTRDTAEPSMFPKPAGAAL